MISSANIPGVYLGVGAFVSGSGNAADWNWCDTKACGRDGGQTKHPITIDMNGTTLGGAKKDCGGMNKNDPKIRRVNYRLITPNNVNHRLATTNYVNHRFTESNYVTPSTAGSLRQAKLKPYAIRFAPVLECELTATVRTPLLRFLWMRRISV
uniref:Uncharacterized protein n=1 Tax=Plectus sambesii TaxID=2011161 RepID=A0A914WQK0_9BILA